MSPRIGYNPECAVRSPGIVAGAALRETYTMHENGHSASEEVIPVLDEDHEAAPEPPEAFPPAASQRPATAGSQPESPDYDPYRSLLRLLVGGALVTTSELTRRLQEFERQYRRSQSLEASLPEPEPPAGVDAPLAAAGHTELLPALSQGELSGSGVQAAVGLLFASYDRTRNIGRRALRVSNLLTRAGRRTTRPIAESRLLKPAGRRFERLAERGAAELAAWREIGRQEETHSRQLARSMFNVTVADVVDYLAVNKEIDELLDAKIDAILNELAGDARISTLIETQVDMLLPRLAGDAELLAFVQDIADRLLAEMGEDARLQSLIKRQGDMYLHYLQVENSEQVQVLIQGQSLGLAGEMLNEVRGRTVTADGVLEGIVRGILRRAPRSELPPPPPEVRALAQAPLAQFQNATPAAPALTAGEEPTID